MNTIFVRQGEYKKGDDAFPLIREALSLYASEAAENIRILRTDEGRPYVDPTSMGRPPEISVTHSGDIWILMVSEHPCGIDFQYEKGRRLDRIAERFFTDGEHKYVEKTGRFFDVWTRRESLGKYTGKGFFGEYPDTCPGGILSDTVNIDGTLLYVNSITAEMLSEAGICISEPFSAAYVSEDDEAPVIRRI